MSSPDGVDVVGVTEAIAGTTVARRDPVVRHELRVDPSEQHAALLDLARQCDDFDVRMHIEQDLETRAHTTKDGRLNLSVDVDVADADVAVVVTVTPVAGGSGVDENGWPEGFFDRVAGSMPELRRGSQGEFEERPSCISLLRQKHPHLIARW